MKNWINGILVITTIFAVSCKTKDDPDAQIRKEIAAIDAALSNGTNYIIVDSLSDRIVIDAFGNDAPPHPSQTVTVSYTAYLFPDGTPFDNGILHEKLSDISIPGLRAGLAVLMKGSRATIFIPSKYAFGSQGTSMVPPNTSVAYEVNLEKVERTAAQQSQFEADTLAIHNYLKANSATIKNPILHPSGVWYTIDDLGVVGASPRPYSQVGFDYEGVAMTEGTTFDKGTLSQINIFYGLTVDGLKIGIPLMEKGNTATFYIPSGLAYGPNGAGTIKPNANLIFTVKLNSIF